MKKVLPTLRYLLKSYSKVIVIGFLSMLVTIAITDVIFYLTDRWNTDHQIVSLTVPFELTTGIFAVMIGLLLFILNFKMMLANGVSRKSYLIANLPAALAAAAVFSLFNLASAEIHSQFWKINFIANLVYPINWFGLLVFQFALYLFLIALGWAIALAYYRSSVPVKWIFTMSPFVLLYLLFADQSRTLYYAIEEPLKILMGLREDPHNHFQAAGSMLAGFALLSGIVYLLLRRAPLKN